MKDMQHDDFLYGPPCRSELVRRVKLEGDPNKSMDTEMWVLSLWEDRWNQIIDNSLSCSIISMVIYQTRVQKYEIKLECS